LGASALARTQTVYFEAREDEKMNSAYATNGPDGSRWGRLCWIY